MLQYVNSGALSEFLNIDWVLLYIITLYHNHGVVWKIVCPTLADLRAIIQRIIGEYQVLFIHGKVQHQSHNPLGSGHIPLTSDERIHVPLYDRLPILSHRHHRQPSPCSDCHVEGRSASYSPQHPLTMV